ncbi:hypothetical protein GJU40_14105 [Bacillus lacus]|uniref:DUF3955 domain-containing protein n=1 Tax=Metabacillus lacus TaxID=1983721 RepID=A0A7X2J0M4_9BACI|nr:hypothetical protein [Metabacillus lacus]MRX73277.1 hypothetical protein [Metabacillus lacus]
MKHSGFSIYLWILLFCSLVGLGMRFYAMDFYGGTLFSTGNADILILLMVIGLSIFMLIKPRRSK